MPSSHRSSAIEVVWLDLDVDDAAHAVLRRTLSAGEAARVSRLATPLLQRRAAARFGWRRVILAEFLEVGPMELDLSSVDVAGRPRVMAPGVADDASFSSSSCESIGILALRAAGALGVDVESLDEVLEADALAVRIATDSELRWLASLSDRAVAAGVLRIWTRKEALAKASGRGIGAGLRAVETFPVSQPDAVLDPWGTDPSWRLFELVCPRDDLAASLAVHTRPGEEPPTLVTSRRDASSLR